MPPLLAARRILLALSLLAAGCHELPNSAADDYAADTGPDDDDNDADSVDASRADADAASEEEEDTGDEPTSDSGKAQEQPDAGDSGSGDGATLEAGPCAPGVMADCMGVCGGNARVDDCNVCNGNNASKDCAGVCGGSAREDCAGVCNGTDLPKTFYRDTDGDGLGDPKAAEALCSQGALVTNRDDCDDTKKGVCAPSDVLRFKRKILATATLPWNQLPMVALGDVDGDLVPDLAMSHVSAAAPTNSINIVFMNADGSVKSARRMTAADFGTPTPALATTLGSALTALGDIDGDAVPDLAVGEPNAVFSATDFGRVWLLFLNGPGAAAGAGSVKARVQVPAPSIVIATGNNCNSASIRWGDKLASFDLDGDGRLELAVGTDRDCRNQGIRVTGRIELYRLAANRSFTSINRVLWDSSPYTDVEFYDATLAAAGDADGDGVGDLAVITPTSKVFTLMLTAAGAVRANSRLTAVSANDAALNGLTRTFGTLPALGASAAPRVLFDLPALSTRGGFGATRAPSSTTTPSYRVFYPKEMGLEAHAAVSAGFGRAGAHLGDLDRDGLPELLVTAPGDDTGGSNVGAGYVLGFAATCDNQTLRGDCNASAADGCETALTSVDHCGACGRSCEGAPNSSAGSCSSEGRCVLTCTPDFGDCNNDVRDGCETDLRTNLQHCGGCGNACPIVRHRLPICTNRTCNSTAICEPLWSDCNGIGNDGCEACGYCGQQDPGTMVPPPSIGAPAGIAPPAAPCLPDQICRRQTWRASSGQVGEFEYAACLTQCPVGRGDCNNNPSDGCEANLTLQTRCGSCSASAICGIWGWLEYCVLNDQGTQYQCTD